MGASVALRGFAPDIVSLQLVGYGYAADGQLQPLRPRFAALADAAGGARRHLMCHELWIGLARGSRVIDRWRGARQRQGLLALLADWDPAVVHTTNPVYREVLLRAGVLAAELPLPGNIPRQAITADAARAMLRDRLGLPATTDSLLLGVVFGAIHPEWAARAAPLQQLRQWAAKQRRTLQLVHVGRTSDAGRMMWHSLARRVDPDADWPLLGEMPSAPLSQLLQGFDLGVATTPWALLGKSGSVAALREHGLQVLVTRHDFQLSRGPTPLPAPQAGIHANVAELPTVERLRGSAGTALGANNAALWLAALSELLPASLKE